MTRERLVRVRDEGELREGAIYVITPLERCRRHTAHRFMLLRREPLGVDAKHGDEQCGAKWRWETLPPPHCSNRTRRCFCGCLPEGRLYRVLDGLSTHSQTSRADRRERVR